ncbi:MAG: VacB/RNase II family 3'-5' exoribonuclease [Kiritimatiellae bacterium]|nr:VacB/RNase II family 3'-5' exoribonuclease [Kiritimatiellia bacterium]
MGKGPRPQKRHRGEGVVPAARPSDPFLEQLHAIRSDVGRRIDPMNAASDTNVVMRAYELPEGFPKGVRAEAKRASQMLDDPGERLDLRDKFIFTCDPETARDYDDALSLETDSQGRRVLGVHIADVSHFVRAGSELDREAYRRSTSVYLVDRVVPMLPEELSNGVCSLVPGEDRLAFSVFLTFDSRGKCVASRFAKSIIRSKARFTYEQVMGMLQGAKVRGLRGNHTVVEIARLAQQLRKARFSAGALDMDVPETEVLLDAAGEMTGLTVRVNDESHQMVEECMVAANAAVAAELWTRGIKILARLHEPPAADKLEELRARLAALGLQCGDLSQGRNLANFLKKIKGHPLEGTLAVMVLRSMKRAVYSCDAIGHYGLAKKFYAHFTSPIRRYPDLVLHRQLAAYLAGKGGRLDRKWLAGAAMHSSQCEQLADDAERTLLEIKKLRYLDACPDVFEAVIGKCTKFGVFVDLPVLAQGGMVHISNLSGRYVRYDEFQDCLTDGVRTWKIGDKMTVRVASVDYKQRWVDFVPAARR